MFSFSLFPRDKHFELLFRSRPTVTANSMLYVRPFRPLKCDSKRNASPTKARKSSWVSLLPFKRIWIMNSVIRTTDEKGERLAAHSIPWLNGINEVKWNFYTRLLKSEATSPHRPSIYIYEPSLRCSMSFHNILFAITMQLLIYFMYIV